MVRGKKSAPKCLYDRWDDDQKLFGHRGGICPCRHCRRQCKIFASGVNFFIFTHFLCFFPTKTVEIRWNWRCKIFSLKIRRCKFLDKFHVWDNTPLWWSTLSVPPQYCQLICIYRWTDVGEFDGRILRQRHARTEKAVLGVKKFE